MAESDVYAASSRSTPECYHTDLDCTALKACETTRTLDDDQADRMGLRECQHCAGKTDNTGPYGADSNRLLPDGYDPGPLNPEAIKRDRARSKRIASIMDKYPGSLNGAARRGGYVRGETDAN